MWGDKLASMMSWDWLQQGRSLQVPVESGKVSLDFYFFFFLFCSFCSSGLVRLRKRLVSPARRGLVVVDAQPDSRRIVTSKRIH